MTITQLIEAGRILSAKNEAALRTAHQAISAVLAGLIASEAAGERSASNKAALIGDYLSDQCEGHDYDCCYVADVFDSTVVYSHGGEYYEAPYAIDDAGVVTLGAPIEVTPRMTYEPTPDATAQATEAELIGDYVAIDGEVALTEAALSEAAIAPIKLIQPGWGSSGYYAKEVLKRDGASTFPKGTKMFWNHATEAEDRARPEGNLDNFAGELMEDAAWQEDGKDGAGLYAKTKVFDRFKSAVKEMKDHIGVSIRAMGRTIVGEAEGKRGNIVSALTTGRSVDFVTSPGAGGKVLDLFEALGRGPTAARAAVAATQITEETSMENTKLAEAEARLTAQGTELARLREAIILTEAQRVVNGELGKVKTLASMTRDRLAESLALNPPVKDGALDSTALKTRVSEAVKAEQDYLTALGVGAVKGHGATTTEVTPEARVASMTESFKQMGYTDAQAALMAKGRN
jgi:hypothetical protein